MSDESRALRARMVGLEGKVQLLAAGAAAQPAAPLSAALWRHEVFAAEITGDNSDGTYTAKRKVATAVNTFADDTDDTATITVGNVAERGGYTAALSVGDIVLVRFDGLTSAGAAIYHVW